MEIWRSRESAENTTIGFENSTNDEIIKVTPSFIIITKINLGLVSDAAFHRFVLSVYVVLLSLVSLLGMSANVVNIVVFVKMGVLRESSNASLLGLALADFSGLATLLVVSVTKLYEELDLPSLVWDPASVAYVAGGWPHIMCAQMTCWITTYIAFERCMCVVFPFKVKAMFTPKLSLSVVVGIMLFFVVNYIPLYCTMGLGWRWDRETNMTRLVAVFRPEYEQVQTVVEYFTSVFSSTLSMAITVICTNTTVLRLNTMSKWRKNTTNSSSDVVKEKAAGNSKTDCANENDTNYDNGYQNARKPGENNTSLNNSKDRQAIKMIVTICVIFIVCNVPGIIIIYLKEVVPGLHHRGAYNNLFYVLYGGSFLLEAVNSSLNILVYVSLSSKYRHTVNTVCGSKVAT